MGTATNTSVLKYLASGPQKPAAENICSGQFVYIESAEAESYPALLHDSICCVPGLDLPIHYDVPPGGWAIPDIVIPLAVAGKMAAILAQLVPYHLFILCH